MQEKFKDYSNVNVETIQDIFMTTDTRLCFEDLTLQNFGKRFEQTEKMLTKFPAREVLKSCVRRILKIRPMFKYVTFEKNSVDIVYPYASIKVYLWSEAPYFDGYAWLSTRSSPQFVGEFGEEALNLPRNFRYDVLYEPNSPEEPEDAEGAITKALKEFENSIRDLTFEDLITLEQRVKQQIEQTMLACNTKIIIELEVPRYREKASIVGDFTVCIGDKEIKYGDLDHTVDLANNSEIKIVL